MAHTRNAVAAKAQLPPPRSEQWTSSSSRQPVWRRCWLQNDPGLAWLHHCSHVIFYIFNNRKQMDSLSAKYLVSWREKLGPVQDNSSSNWPAGQVLWHGEESIHQHSTGSLAPLSPAGAFPGLPEARMYMLCSQLGTQTPSSRGSSRRVGKRREGSPRSCLFPPSYMSKLFILHSISLSSMLPGVWSAFWRFWCERPVRIIWTG